MTKKIFSVLAAIVSIVFFNQVQAQTDSLRIDSVPSVVDAAIQDNARQRMRQEREGSRPKVDLSKRANDHLMIQLGYLGWSGAEGLEQPASKFNREVNVAFMYDKPFKSNPKISVGLGVGYSGGNVFFNNVDWALKEPSTSNGRIAITDVSNQRHFEKYKLVTQYLEAPVELRFASNAEKPAKGFRAAIGMKFGYLVKAHTKGKNLVEAVPTTGSPATVYGKNYILKEVEGSNYLNQTRFTGTIRFGYNIVNVFATYQLNPLFRAGATQGNIRPFSVGIGLGIL